MRYRPGACPRCGGWLYWDFEDKEWCCLGCSRRFERPISVNKNPISTDNNAITTGDKGVNVSRNSEKAIETPAISKGRRPFIPARVPKRIYKGHSIDGIWWPPKEITFSRKQMLGLIRNLPQLRVKHLSIATEIESRLEKCGIDGLILEAIECWGKSEQSLAKYLGMPSWSVRKRAKNALRYISGWKRRKQSYKVKVSSMVNKS